MSLIPEPVDPHAVGLVCDACAVQRRTALLQCGRVPAWLEALRVESPAVLDVLDAEGDIVQEFGIKDARAFQRIKAKLGLRVEASE